MTHPVDQMSVFDQCQSIWKQADRGLRQTDICCVVCSSENQLRSSIVSRTYIANIGLSGHKDFCGPKITKFKDTRRGIEKKILRLYVSVAYTNGMYVREGSEKLVHVQLDLKHWHGLLQLDVVARSAIYSLWDVFLNEVEVDFIFLGRKVNWRHETIIRVTTHFVSVGIKEGFQLDDVRMRNQSHDLELAVLLVTRKEWKKTEMRKGECNHNGRILACLDVMLHLDTSIDVVNEQASSNGIVTT